jgi:hypothetical protein
VLFNPRGFYFVADKPLDRLDVLEQKFVCFQGPNAGWHRVESLPRFIDTAISELNLYHGHEDQSTVA